MQNRFTIQKLLSKEKKQNTCFEMPLLLQNLAALIGVRCIQFVERELKLEIERVLNWIGSQRTLTKFVENRLKGIRSDIEINSHFIASLENPADFASNTIS